MTATKTPLTAMAWMRWDGIQRALREAAPTSVLEIGAGQGAMGARLAAIYDYTGVELDPESASVAQGRIEPAGRFVSGTVDDLGPGERFDLVCAFEVLEHIEDDVEAVRSWRERMDDAGWMLLSVPAHPERFSGTDAHVGHFRRYSRAMLTDVLGANGLEVVRVESYGAGVGHLLEWGRELIRSRTSSDDAIGTGASGRYLQPRGVTGAATAAAGGVGRVVQRPMVRGDRGVGWIALARRSR